VSERDPRDVIRIEELERENAALREELARVRGELKELTRIVEELQKRARKDKRQAHLFRRESEKKDKKQAAYYICAMTLGKLAFLLKQKVERKSTT
jgi:predicted nuclease with TOPRIM domain